MIFFSASKLFNKQPGFLWERREKKEIPRTAFEGEIVVVRGQANSAGKDGIYNSVVTFCNILTKVLTKVVISRGRFKATCLHKIKLYRSVIIHEIEVETKLFQRDSFQKMQRDVEYSLEKMRRTREYSLEKVYLCAKEHLKYAEKED